MLSSISRHLDCLHIFVTVSNVKIYKGMHMPFQISAFVFSDIYPGVELMDCMVVLFLIFRGNSMLFPILVEPVTTNSVGEFPFPHICARM